MLHKEWNRMVNACNVYDKSNAALDIPPKIPPKPAGGEVA